MDLFEIKMKGSQMYLRKRSFSTFVKFVQKAINQHSNIDGWANIKTIVTILQNSDFNFSSYEDAIKSIHSGWIEFSVNGNMVKISKVMP